METFNREAGSFEPHHFRTQRDRDIRVSLNLMSTPDVGRVGGEGARRCAPFEFRGEESKVRHWIRELVVCRCSIGGSPWVCWTENNIQIGYIRAVFLCTYHSHQCTGSHSANAKLWIPRPVYSHLSTDKTGAGRTYWRSR